MADRKQIAGAFADLIMQYFEHFDLSPAFMLDDQELRRKYLVISKKYHPDFFVNDPEKHEEALKMTSLNNKAYETLRDDLKRVAYNLKSEGLLSEKGGELDPMFLMEMMEWNERTSDAGLEGNVDELGRINEEFQAFQRGMIADLQEACRACDDDRTDATLQKVLEFYLKSRYLLRIKESIDKFAAL